MAEETQETMPREEIIAWYKQAIEVQALRTEYAELLFRESKARVENIQAKMFMAQIDAAAQEAEAKMQSEVAGGEATDVEKPTPGELRVEK